MILEKVYDELYGMIEDLKKKIQAAEKSDVTITPALESGTKVADFEIDGTEGSIYAPTQVNADWNAAEGPAEILNKPTIPATEIAGSSVETGLGWVLWKFGNLRIANFVDAVIDTAAGTSLFPAGSAPTTLGQVTNVGWLSDTRELVKIILTNYNTIVVSNSAGNTITTSKLRGMLVWVVDPVTNQNTRTKTTKKK